MKEFDIREVREGDTLPLRDGLHKGKILCFADGLFPILVLITGPNPELHGEVLRYNMLGKNQWSTSDEYPHDLMLHSVEDQKYIAIFKHTKNDVMHVHHEVLESIESATKLQDNPAYAKWEITKIQPVTGV